MSMSEQMWKSSRLASSCLIRNWEDTETEELFGLWMRGSISSDLTVPRTAKPGVLVFDFLCLALTFVTNPCREIEMHTDTLTDTCFVWLFKKLILFLSTRSESRHDLKAEGSCGLCFWHQWERSCGSGTGNPSSLGIIWHHCINLYQITSLHNGPLALRLVLCSWICWHCRTCLQWQRHLRSGCGVPIGYTIGDTIGDTVCTAWKVWCLAVSPEAFLSGCLPIIACRAPIVDTCRGSLKCETTSTYPCFSVLYGWCALNALNFFRCGWFTVWQHSTWESLHFVRWPFDIFRHRLASTRSPSEVVSATLCGSRDSGFVFCPSVNTDLTTTRDIKILKCRHVLTRLTQFWMVFMSRSF